MPTFRVKGNSLWFSNVSGYCVATNIIINILETWKMVYDLIQNALAEYRAIITVTVYVSAYKCACVCMNKD